MDTPNALRQARQLLSQLIENQERFDASYETFVKAAARHCDYRISPDKFLGESFMLTHLKNLQELLEKADE